MQLVDDDNGKLGDWKLKNEALDLTVWGISFGRGYGSLARLLNY
jgi:hypothetical protein